MEAQIVKQVIRIIKFLIYSILKTIFLKVKDLVMNKTIISISIKQLKMMKNNNLLTK